MKVLGSHVVGGTRYLYPVGTEMTQWGARIIPEGQTLYPQGFAGAIGTASVWNYVTYARPIGFRTSHDTDFRFGRQHVWNLRQYIVQEFDGDSGLVPPPWSLWQKIENRNRYLGQHGASMQSLGRPQIDLGAHAFAPPGIAPPAWTPKAPMVAERIRPLPVPGIEPPYLSGWATVFNAAKPIKPPGLTATQWGSAHIVSNRREYRWITAGLQSIYGYPMVAYRVRGIDMERRYAIEPPAIQLPEVKLHTRYVEVPSNEFTHFGNTALYEKFNIITPRWTLRDLIGEPRLHNVTPEVSTHGYNQELYGDALVRLQWRPVNPVGDLAQRFGGTIIARRTRIITLSGLRSLGVSTKAVVTQIGGMPPQQNVSPSSFPPLLWLSNDQVPKPSINQQVVYVKEEFPQTKWGTALVAANSLRVEPGIWERLIGAPMVSLKRRVLSVAKFPDAEVFEPEKPRLSPHTIYAVAEAPPQAQRNHPLPPPFPLHYVGELDDGVGVSYGRPAVTLRNRVIRPQGYLPYNPGEPRMQLHRRYLGPTGINSLRFGWPEVPGPRDLVVYGAPDTVLWGATAIARGPYYGPQTVSAGAGEQTRWPPTISRHWVSLLNQPVYPAGYLAERMGTRLPNDQPFMWQGLRVGPHVPNTIAGFNAQAHGTPWVSHRVRDVRAEGFDAFLCEYDIRAFKHRMRVWRRAEAPLRKTVAVAGLDTSGVGTPGVKPMRHYIRPDGNADQYRKGVH